MSERSADEPCGYSAPFIVQPGRTPATSCARLNVSRQTINALEVGKYDPSLPLAFAIARLFRLSIEEIFEPDCQPPVEP